MRAIPSGYAAEIADWRRWRLARLTAPDGWLSVIGLHWLAEGRHRIGSDPSAQIRLPIGAAQDLGWIEASGTSATFHSRSGAVPLSADPAAEHPFLRSGSLSLSLIARGGRFAVRVRDSESAARRAFTGIRSFPVDPVWRFDARFETYSPPRRIPVRSVLGTVDEETSPGAVVFEARGGVHRLEGILEAGETDYWVVFGDATNGRETYGGGRFVYVRPPSDGRTVIDFNRAYNPPCVFTSYSTCPLPSPQNRLTIAIEAGEKKS